MKIDPKQDHLPGLEGGIPIVIMPPGAAHENEHEFVLWLQEQSRRLIAANLGWVNFIPMIDEYANILVRTDPLDPLQFRLVAEALQLAPGQMG